MGLEPTTSSMPWKRCYQLSYRPSFLIHFIVNPGIVKSDCLFIYNLKTNSIISVYPKKTHPIQVALEFVCFQAFFKRILKKNFKLFLGHFSNPFRQLVNLFLENGKKYNFHYLNKSFTLRSLIPFPFLKSSRLFSISSSNSFILKRCLKYSLVLANLPFLTSRSTFLAMSSGRDILIMFLMFCNIFYYILSNRFSLSMI